MLIKSFHGLLAALALGFLAGCATPCGAPGRLCAPAQPNTSEREQAAAAAPPFAAPAAPGPQASAQPAQPAPQAPQPPAAPLRIALLVPLDSPTLGLPAQAVRDGFLAAYEHDRAGFEVEVVATGDPSPATLEAYRQAAQRADVVVGPLARSAVGELAGSGLVNKPTIALNHPESDAALPPHMLAMGLSVEDEARQAADWAAREHPQGRALILAGDGPWQRRVAQAFEQRWSELGRDSHLAELPAEDSRVDSTAIDVVRTRIEQDPPELMFAALDAAGLRQVRSTLGTAIPCYATSPANPGKLEGQSMPELDGVRLLDVPWEVQPDQQAVRAYPRPPAGAHTPETERLYALGIDAFRVARALAEHPDAPVDLDGVTGKLSARLQPAPAFSRSETAAVYSGGAFQAPAAGR
jgi:outer membrane PBP1 activator LpoA protein